jgi:hypothetical protein
MNLREYTASLTYSTLAFNGSTARVSNASLSRNFSFGQLMIRDQFQLKNFHRYGAEWQFFIPRGSLRVGLDRVVNLRAEDRSFAPLLGLNFALPGKQRLVTTYSGERGAHTVHVYIAGPVITRDDIRRGEDGRVSVVSPASLEGRVFHDVNGDNAFTSNTDIPMPGIRIWLDRNNSVITDAQGAYRFSNLKSGTHAVRADLAEVPADMVFADSGDRRVALLPFRDNVQNFAVVRTGSVSGKVTFLDYSRDPDKPTSRPLAEARVIADSEHDTYSDLSGNITLGSLRPGAYQLKVDPETAPEGYVASVEPQEIVVKAGENLSGIQIQLKLAPRKVVSQELPRQSIDVP